MPSNPEKVEFTAVVSSILEKQLNRENAINTNNPNSFSSQMGAARLKPKYVLQPSTYLRDGIDLNNIVEIPVSLIGNYQIPDEKSNKINENTRKRTNVEFNEPAKLFSLLDERNSLVLLVNQASLEYSKNPQDTTLKNNYYEVYKQYQDVQNAINSLNMTIQRIELGEGKDREGSAPANR